MAPGRRALTKRRAFEPAHAGGAARIVALTRLARTSLAALAAALSLAAAAAPAEADWPMYGHDLSNTRSGGTDGPLRGQIAGLAQKWRFNSPTGDFTGTPAIASGVLVAGDYSGMVYALDAVTGKVRWKKQLGGPINGSAAIDIHAPRRATVYVPVAKEGAPRIVALALATGATRWSTAVSHQAGSSLYGSPTFWDGRVYVGTSGPQGDGSSARGSVVALDQGDGSMLWQTFMVPPGRDGGPVWSTPAIDVNTGRLYVGTGNAYHPPVAPMTDSIVSLDTLGGQVLGHYQAVAGDIFSPSTPLGKDSDFGASPNLFTAPGGKSLVGEGNKDGSYYAVEADTMKFAWKASIGPGGSALGGLIGSTAFDGDKIFATATLTGQVKAIGRNGGARWSSPDGGSPDFSPLAHANGVLYTLTPSGLLTMRDAASGAVLNAVSVGGQTFGGIATTGRAVYVAVGTGPPPPPAPQQDGKGSIVAFGDTSKSGKPRPRGGGGGGSRGSKRSRCRAHGGVRMRVRVRPNRVRAGVRKRFRFVVTCKGKRVRAATVAFAGRHKPTDRKGRTTIRVRFRHAGRKVARAKKHGLRSGRATVRVRRRR